METIESKVIPARETQRLQRLRELNILDSGPESTYDRITMIACEVFGDSEAFLCFVDESRIFLKSKTGHPNICDFMNGSSYWRTMLLSSKPIFIKDLSVVPDRLPKILTQHFKSYASSGLQTEDGHVLGSLIVLGRDTFGQENRKFKILSDLATLLMDQLTIRLESKKAFSVYDEVMNQTVHDLKNPLSSIQLGAEIMGLSSSDEFVRKDFSDIIIRNVKRVMARLDNLLTLSKREDKIKIKKTSLDFIELLSSVIHNLSEISKNKSQILDLDGPANLCFYGDINMLESIFENLISNAIKFSPLNSAIKISVRVQEQNIITVIEDHGSGLNKADHARLFVRFAKLSATPTASESSHGLGLSIVKMLVELHRGNVWAESDGKDKGTRFYVSLPIR